MGKFRKVVLKAVAGDHASVLSVIGLYSSLIKAQSIVDGKYNEDLAQHIILSILGELPKFVVSDLCNDTNFK